MKSSSFIKYVALPLLLLNFSVVTAQKHKDIQENSVFASVPVKIDGKLNDWQDTVQAFNRSALLGYTIANNDQYLYLVIKSSDALNSAKILAGGITFTINTEGKKKDKDAFGITFPVVNTVTRSPGQTRPAVMPGMQRQTGSGRMQRPDRGNDSLMMERRKAQLAQFKEIKVHGFNEITDSLISIYNEYGIKAAAGYDTQGSLIYEMAVPLKALNLTANSKNEIAYNIKVNGRSFAGRNFGTYQAASGAGERGRRDDNSYAGNRESVISFTEPVDFWGKYSLAIQ